MSAFVARCLFCKTHDGSNEYEAEGNKLQTLLPATASYHVAHKNERKRMKRLFISKIF